MTGNNAMKMTLEENLVQHLKENTIQTLVGDEDALTELTRRALHEALFQPKRINEGSTSYPQWREKDSLVVETAKGLAEKYLQKVIQEQVEEILKDDKVKQAIKQAVMLFLPSVIQNGLHQTLQTLAADGGKAGIEILKQAGIIDPNRHYGY